MCLWKIPIPESWQIKIPVDFWNGTKRELFSAKFNDPEFFIIC